MSPDLTELTTRQLRDYDAHNPGTIFAEPIPLGLHDAYAMQSEICRLRELRGDGLVGYKVGCTSPTIQRQLKINQPVFGRLFRTDSWESGMVLPSTQFSRPAVEGELAVRLAHDIKVDASDEEIFAALDSVFAVIEMHNLVFRRSSPSVEELVANNCVHAGFVYPPKLPPFSRDDTSSLQIEIDDVVIATVPGAELMRTVLDSLSWLSRQLQPRELGLRAGQTILCGSVAPVIPVSAGTRISVRAGQFGLVQCSIS